MPVSAAAKGIWTQAAAGTATGAIGMGIQRLGVNYDHRKQREQNEKLMAQQIAGEEELMKLQNKYQLEMWDKTGYGAQVKQMKEAGINPALLYGMSGGGGQSMGAGMPGISTATAENPKTSQGTAAMMGMGLQAAAQVSLLQAQKENVEAQTENLKAGTGKTKQDEKLSWEQTHKAEMDNLVQEIAQNTDSKGKDTEGDIQKSAAVAQMRQQIAETAKRIELLREEGETQDEMQKKINNETQLLKNEIDWQALDITGDNAGSVIEKVMKLIVGFITGAKGLKGSPAKGNKGVAPKQKEKNL